MRRPLTTLVLAASLLAACGDDSGSSGSAGTPDASTAASAGTDAPIATVAAGTDASSTVASPTGATEAPIAEAPEALQFAAPLAGGGTLAFTQYAGTTLALWFWAPT